MDKKIAPYPSEKPVVNRGGGHGGPPLQDSATPWAPSSRNHHPMDKKIAPYSSEKPVVNRGGGHGGSPLHDSATPWAPPSRNHHPMDKKDRSVFFREAP